MTGVVVCGVCGCSFAGSPSPELAEEVRGHMVLAHALDLPGEHYDPFRSPAGLRAVVEQQERRRARAAFN